LDFKSGEREVILGKFLPVMQEMSNFVDRCYALALNIIQQLGSLFNAKEPTYRSLLLKAHVRCMFSRLGELLQMLITIDSVVQSNTTLHGRSFHYNFMLVFLSAVTFANATMLMVPPPVLMHFFHRMLELLQDPHRSCS
jgi:hypothetical protein